MASEAIMADRISSQGIVGASSLPRVKVNTSELSTPASKQPSANVAAESAASHVSFSGLGRSVANNAQATTSLNKISRPQDPKRSADAQRDVAEANKASSEASVDDVVSLADQVARDISYRPEEALSAYRGSEQAADLLK